MLAPVLAPVLGAGGLTCLTARRLVRSGGLLLSNCRKRSGFSHLRQAVKPSSLHTTPTHPSSAATLQRCKSSLARPGRSQCSESHPPAAMPQFRLLSHEKWEAVECPDARRGRSNKEDRHSDAGAGELSRICLFVFPYGLCASCTSITLSHRHSWADAAITTTLKAHCHPLHLHLCTLF